MSRGMCIENDNDVTSPTTAFAQRRRSCHVFAMVHQNLLQAIGRGTPQFFLVYRVKVKRRMFYSFYRKFGRFEVSEFHFERFDFIPPSRPIFFNFHWKNMEIDLKISFDVVEDLSSLRSPINVYSTSKS